MDFSIVEELWFGDTIDDVAERKAAESMTAMTVKVVGLRSFPEVVHRVIKHSRSPDCSLEELARLIESDASFASRTLRLVNSAALHTKVRCTSIVHAVRLLGVRTIAEMATAMAALDLYDNETAFGIRLRKHATVTAALSRHLAMHLGLPIDDLYTCALIHDIGKLFMLDSGPDDYACLVEKTSMEADTTHLIERENFGFDHAVLGAHVLSTWEIPDPVPICVAWHHQPARAFAAGGDRARVVSLVRLADRIAHTLESDLEPREAWNYVSKDSAADYLEITTDDARNWWDELRDVAIAGGDPLGENKEFTSGGTSPAEKLKRNALFR